MLIALCPEYVRASCLNGFNFRTQFANGGCLASLVSAKGVDLPWSVRAALALDIAKGVNYLHSQNVIHRDLSSVVSAHCSFRDR
ncbi:unnamed protein product [Echinostoma caproni]|uniref:Protein kinase domain-containing protein n=1 Tax=Echinostoma caproni TaxID=27848 RepID=A0A183B2B3_9TREM|nr:unnamed protein product [Echinostoma caproni]